MIPPRPGVTVSADGRTTIVLGGAKADTKEMVRAADDLKKPLQALGSGAVTVSLTGASGMWSDFNAANHSSMMRSDARSCIAGR